MASTPSFVAYSIGFCSKLFSCYIKMAWFFMIHCTVTKSLLLIAKCNKLSPQKSTYCQSNEECSLRSAKTSFFPSSAASMQGVSSSWFLSMGLIPLLIKNSQTVVQPPLAAWCSRVSPNLFRLNNPISMSVNRMMFRNPSFAAKCQISTYFFPSKLTPILVRSSSHCVQLVIIEFLYLWKFSWVTSSISCFIYEISSF